MQLQLHLVVARSNEDLFSKSPLAWTIVRGPLAVEGLSVVFWIVGLLVAVFVAGFVVGFTTLGGGTTCFYSVGLKLTVCSYTFGEGSFTGCGY